MKSEIKVPNMRTLLRGIGWKRFFTSIDFWVAFIATVILGTAIGRIGLAPDTIKVAMPTLIAASGALIAVSLAGLAILVSLADPEFVRILRSKKVWDNLLMFFWIPAFSSAICIGLSLFTLVLQLAISEPLTLTIFLSLSIGSFVYSVSSLILALGTAVRFGHYRAEFLIKGLIGGTNATAKKSDDVDKTDTMIQDETALRQ